jgi:predicted nucleic acid-binding protein
LQKKYSEETLLSAIEFVKSYAAISAQDNDEYRLLEKKAKNDIDPGEATLIAATFHESASLLATGDQRCLKALATTECLYLIRKKLKGRVICLEQVIYKLITTKGFDWVLERVLPNQECDKALKSAFGSDSNSQCETVLETLTSYIEDLQIISLRILADL